MPDSQTVPGELASNRASDAGGDNTWLRLAQDAYQRSTSYFDNNYRKQVEDGLNMFHSRHPQDSKYKSDNYKYRSRIFRPKTRSVVRKHEATAALALFTNPDVVSISPVNEDDPMQAAGSALMKEILQYRLRKSIPWFLTSLGAFQDAMTVGICASMQYWDYREETQTVMREGMLPDGTPVEFEEEQGIPVVDKPCVELIPIENIRFDPAAKWNDVVGSSPYLVVQWPMYVRDILDKMESGEWRRYDKNVILQSRVTTDNSVQAARDGNKENPQQETSEFNEFDTVVTHFNFIKVATKTYAYWTLSDKHLLTEPGTLEDLYGSSEMPVVVGFCILESHISKPPALIELGKELQKEANEIVNQRLDNVKFVLNKRYFVRRGGNVDVDSMLRNVPGGVTMLNDVDKDVREVNWQDVTSSAYAEQDRVNVDYDELLGNFAQSSVMTNRKLGETVGGMRMIAQGANVLAEYTIRMWVETWVEPVLRQLVKLEQRYESDATVIAIAGQKAKLWRKFNMDPENDALLSQELTTAVNVGMGATDPDTRFARFMQALGAYNQVAQQGSPEINLPEIRKELFSLAGYPDSLRFFTEVDPRLIQAQQLAAKAEGEAKQVVDKAKDRINRRNQQLDNRSRDLDIRELAMRVDDQLEKDVRNVRDEMQAGNDW